MSWKYPRCYKVVVAVATTALAAAAEVTTNLNLDDLYSDINNTIADTTPVKHGTQNVEQEINNSSDVGSTSHVNSKSNPAADRLKKLTVEETQEELEKGNKEDVLILQDDINSGLGKSIPQTSVQPRKPLNLFKSDVFSKIQKDSSLVSDEQNKKKKLELNPDALAYLDTLDGPLYSVSAIGPARVGKSFWLGQLAKLHGHNGTLFEVSDTSDSCTEGAWFIEVPWQKREQFSITDAHLLFFDIQGSDKGTESDLILTDQISAFVGLFSSAVLFFLDRHIETSKLLFYDRVIHASRILRNDSNYELNTDFVIRRPLRLPKRFKSRSEEFKETLGEKRLFTRKKAKFSSGENLKEEDNTVVKVFELPELELEDEDGKERPDGTTLWAQKIWDFIFNFEESKIYPVSTKNLESNKESTSSQKQSSNYHHHHQYSNTQSDSSNPSDSTTSIDKPASSSATKKNVQGVGKNQFSVKPLQLSDGTILNGPGLRMVMEETIKWLQNDNLDEFFVAVDSVRDKVCKAQMHLVEAMKQAKYREDLQTLVYPNYQKFKDWCHDMIYLSAARSVLYMVEKEVAENEKWRLISGIAWGVVWLGILGISLMVALVNSARMKMHLQRVTGLLLGRTLYVVRCFLSCILPAFLLSNRTFKRWWDLVIDTTKDVSMFVFGKVCNKLLVESSSNTSNLGNIMNVGVGGGTFDPQQDNKGDPTQFHQNMFGRVANFGNIGSSSNDISFGTGIETSSSTLCTVTGYVVLEFFTSYISYVLYLILGSLIWHLLEFRYGFQILNRIIPNWLNVKLSYYLYDLPSLGITRISSILYQKMMGKFLEVANLQRRPKITNRITTWDLQSEDSEQRRYTDQCIRNLQNSPEYNLKCNILKTVKPVPTHWDYESHYAQFGNNTAINSEGFFPGAIMKNNNKKMKSNNNTTSNSKAVTTTSQTTRQLQQSLVVIPERKLRCYDNTSNKHDCTFPMENVAKFGHF